MSLVEQVEERAGLDQADYFGVGQQVESELAARAIEEFVLSGPGVGHRAFVDFAACALPRISMGVMKSVRACREDQQRTRAGDHAMALVLAVAVWLMRLAK